MASRKIGTRGNPSSPLNLGVSDPEGLLREIRRNLVSTSSEKFKIPETLEIPEATPFPTPSSNTQSGKGSEESDLLSTPLKFEKLQVFTNPLIPEQVKLEALKTPSIQTHLLKTFSANQPSPSILSSSSQQSSGVQLNPNPKMAQPPPNRMATMIAARYAPLVLPQALNALPGGDYQKYMPRFNGQGDATAEKHWNKFYSFADNQNYEHTDVWMGLFVQSLDGEVRKWFRELPPNSIDGIDALEDTFMKQWGDTKYYLYYQTEFHALKRKKGEAVGYFSKRFNKMYSKIPAEIKPTETAAKLAYANSFNPEFSLLLRERKSESLQNMQSAALEVESNILASNRLKEETEHQIVDRKGKK